MFQTFQLVDVTRAESVNAAVRQLLTDRGTPKLVIYCASQLYQGAIAERNDAELQSELEVNYLEFVRLARVLATLKSTDARLRLVATASALGYVGALSLDNYSAAKAALISFTRSARYEMASHGIDLAVVSPPHMENGADLHGPKRLPVSWVASRFAREAAGHRREYLLGASNRSLLQMTH